MNREIVKVFRALSDPNRIRIVKMLEERELCVCEVREILKLSNSTVSKHLSVLHDAGLIAQSKEGKWVNYRLNSKSDNQFIGSLVKLLKASLQEDESVRRDSELVSRVDRNKICQV
ncbi:MAG: metalloregulator ArsR/SmtB family transcription factor [Bacteroidetes bacterium]|nr:metalloregulator ArsR/SmtB family transcription factor [Bacteroidota bacterium]MCL5739189.1 metalloregulator ArsR/SmtB family transcription factor [Bacteroidota bacterium]